MRRPRLGVRTRLLVAIVGAFAIALAVAVTAFSFLLGGRLDASATALARAETEAELSSLEIVDGVLLAPAAPDDGTTTSRVWVFAGSRVLEDPNAPSAVEEAARSLVGGPARSLDIGEETRLFSLPIIDNGTRQGTVVSAVSLRPYEETGQTALVGAIVLALLLLGAVFVLSRWLLGHALQPVSKMTEDAAAWSEHDLDRRFDLGEPHERRRQPSAGTEAQPGEIRKTTGVLLPAAEIAVGRRLSPRDGLAVACQ